MVLEARRLHKRQFFHDAVIARNKAKVDALGIEVEEAAAAAALALEAGKTYGTKLREGLSQTFSAENVGATIARAFEAGEGLMSALKSIGAQMATNLGSFFSETLSSIPIVGPFLGQFGGLMVAGLVKLGGKLWSGIKSLFGGPSEAEQAAREMFAGFHAGVVDELSGTQRYADEVQRAINDGWGRTLAETRAGFILTGTAAGLTYDESFAYYERYQHAVGAGNTELMTQIEADYARWEAAAAETNASATASAEASAAAQAAAYEQASSAALSAFKASEAAGVSAYDEMIQASADYFAAVADGDEELALEIISNNGDWVTNTEEAHAAATAAALSAKERVIAAKLEEYVFDAAMNAAMSLGANATAEERKAAARGAAQVARESWGAAMVAVAASDQAANDAMNETWNPDTGDVVTNVHGASEAIQADMAAAERDIKLQFEKMALDADIEAKNIQAAFNAIEIKDQSFTIREHRDFSYSGHQSFEDDETEGRQHGGPVSAGRPYMVGERGPEMFIPGSSGSVASNKSLPTAEEIGAAVAAALHRVPLVVPQDAVTDSILRRTPNRQALRGWA